MRKVARAKVSILLAAGLAVLAAVTAAQESTPAENRLKTPNPVRQTPLQSLIRENVMSAVQADQAYATRKVNAPKVWIHIRDARQRHLASTLNQRLAAVSIAGMSLSPQPVQQVPSGPSVDELRYFGPSDREGAELMIQALRGDLPRVKLKDLSAEYAQVTWIKPGHYELWLAPPANRPHRT